MLTSGPIENMDAVKAKYAEQSDDEVSTTVLTYYRKLMKICDYYCLTESEELLTHTVWFVSNFKQGLRNWR